MTVKLHFIPFMTLLFIILLAGCGGGPQNGSNQGEIPLVPVEMVQQMGGVSHFRAPIQIEDTQLQLFEYDANGERQMGLYSEVVFPVDVMVAYFETTDSVVVYLRRSPHGGCLDSVGC